MEEKEDKKFTYLLPEAGTFKATKHQTYNNAVIIIGANGSGKSHLGAWMEKQDLTKVHRIGSQRSLNFQEHIPLKSYEQAEHSVLWGNEDPQTKNKVYRWSNEQSYTTKLLDDFNHVLSALVAQTNLEKDKFFNECKNAEQVGTEKPHTPTTSIDKLLSVWQEVFPQRYLEYADTKFTAYLTRDKDSHQYPSNQMSDGERAVIYLTAQVLCVPKDMTLIVDEPEVHVHRSIMNRLWQKLEQMRPDCLFIYITHDTQFAAMHTLADKIWIKKYDGKNWEFEKLEENELPEGLLLDILGNRKNILFTEGEAGSLDSQLYSEIFPDHYVIPCGSCVQVIERTKAFRGAANLHHFKVSGLIDRDYRSEEEIQSLANHGIYTLEVAEVENLFLVEELICCIAKHNASDPDAEFKKVKKQVISRFNELINNQILQAASKQVKHQLACIPISSKSANAAESELNSALANVDYSKTMDEVAENFKAALDNKDYKQILKVFNEKSLAKTIGEVLGYKNQVYCDVVIRLLKNNLHDEIVSALRPYFPSELLNMESAQQS